MGNRSVTALTRDYHALVSHHLTLRSKTRNELQSSQTTNLKSQAVLSLVFLVSLVEVPIVPVKLLLEICVAPAECLRLLRFGGSGIKKSILDKSQNLQSQMSDIVIR